MHMYMLMEIYYILYFDTNKFESHGANDKIAERDAACTDVTVADASCLTVEPAHTRV